jgi:hypothetical protein
MKYKYISVIGLILFLVGTVQASEQRGALVLNKIPIYEFEDARKLGCTELYDVKFGRNVPDMRSFPNRNAFCQGRYEMTVRGEKGRTVTLYAQYNFGQEGGFLVVRKTDDQLVWISDLEDLPSGKWTTIPASRQSGGYEAFYHDGSGFDQNLSSIKWGRWWQGDIPRKKGYQASNDEELLNR